MDPSSWTLIGGCEGGLPGDTAGLFEPGGRSRAARPGRTSGWVPRGRWDQRRWPYGYLRSNLRPTASGHGGVLTATDDLLVSEPDVPGQSLRSRRIPALGQQLQQRPPAQLRRHLLAARGDERVEVTVVFSEGQQVDGRCPGDLLQSADQIVCMTAERRGFCLVEAGELLGVPTCAQEEPAGD